MGLTGSGYALLSSALSLVVAGVALGNIVLALLGAFALLLLLATTTRASPVPVVKRRVPSPRLRKGEEAFVDVDVEVPPALGFVELHQPLPAEFTLEGGSNLHVVQCSPDEPRFARFRVRFRATKRGTFTLPPLEYEVVSLLGLEAPVTGRVGEEVVLEVSPRVADLSAPEARRALARRAATEVDVSRLGARGTDYRELRTYAWGDPPKSINWKATARRMAAGTSFVPLVNDYERDGKRTVFVLVDASSTLEVGTSVDSVLDHVLDAAQALAVYFLSRNYRVGAYAFNARSADPIYPDLGHAHAERIRVALSSVEPGDGREGLSAAVERCHGFLSRGGPLVFVVTSVTGRAEPTLDGVRRLRLTLAGPSGRRPPVVVVDVRPYGLMPGEGPHAAEARVLLDALDRPAARAVQRAGATIVPWDPSRTPFTTAFVRRVRA